MRNSKTNRKLEKNDTEDLILQKAMKMFLEKGYHGTSIDDITKAAGLTKGALYWHFKSKEQLLKKIIEEFESRFLNGLIKAVQNIPGGFLEKVEKFFRYNAAFSYYNRELCVSFTTLAAELVGAKHETEKEFRRIYKKYQRFLYNLIRQGKKENVLKKDLDPNLTGLTIIAFHDGVLLRWFMNHNEIDGKAYVETFKKIILYGLMA